MSKINQVKNAILELISSQKYLYEDDYNALCYDLDAKEASVINDWIIQSYIPVRKNDVGAKYKRKVKNIVKHPTLPNQEKIPANPKKEALSLSASVKSIVTDIRKLAGAFEEEVGMVESAIRKYKDEYPKLDWKAIDRLFEDAKRSYSVSKLRTIWDYFKNLRFVPVGNKFLNTVKFNGITFHACVAASNEDKVKGLEIFSSLEDRCGMLFPFEKNEHVTFHMGSVQFPIDIIFITNTFSGPKVAKIIHNVQPGDSSFWSCNSSSYVLEIPGGSCKKYNINIADFCVIE